MIRQAFSTNGNQPMAGFIGALVLGALMVAMLAPVLVQDALAESTPVPDRYARGSEGYAGEFVEVFEQLDAFWARIFSDAGVSYRSPRVFTLVDEVWTGCGPASPRDAAVYCPPDEAVLYSPAWLAQQETRIGDFVPILVMAHEWGHHVQNLLGTVREPGNTFELQADCFAGAYANEAGQQGMLDPGDITEAVMGSASFGDPLGLPQDAPGAHGINDDRVIAFMRGYLDGISGCGWTLAVGRDGSGAPPLNQDHSATALSVSMLLPTSLILPQGQPFRVESEGVSSFTDMLATFAEDPQSRQLLESWGWEENVYRIFASDSPPPNAVGWLSIGIHRFSSIDGAAAALTYFADSSRNNLGYIPVDVGLFSDQTEAFAGRAVNGNELVIYARRGNLIFRASGIAPDGDPTVDVFEAILIPLRQLVDEPRVVSAAIFDLLPNDAHVDAGLHVSERHARSAGTIATTFPNVAEAERLFQTWGWRESAAYVFTGQSRFGTSRLEVSVFRLADEQSAAAALPYFLNARAAALMLSPTAAPPARGDEVRAIAGQVAGGQEATVYVRRGANLYRISAIGEGNPKDDLAELLKKW